MSSASQCPLCHAPVKDDFGLLECPGCGAQLIVHMDGRVEYQGAKETSQIRDEAAAAPPAYQEPQYEPIREFELDLSDDSAPPVDPDAAPSVAEEPEPTQMRTLARAQDLVPPAGGTGAGHRMPEDDLYDANRDYTKEVAHEEDGDSQKEFLGSDNSPAVDEAVEEVPDHTEVTGPAAAAESEDLFPDFERQDPDQAPVAYNAGPVSSSPDLGDVAKFGNSDLSGGREGPLRYNLFIEGIDTVDVREAFREALTDRKLMWDTDQILRSVRNGRVNIPNVAPTKAYILITRLRGMPVQVRWEQYAISQT